ncbi:TraX family protein [Vagococcus intermedius]|uniref:Conjugal transfer protein TraX n=1 Tax=Vagococcus intermedius TaxID=2991418 RepID=A0AAF0I773_9ENTE|nr:TraX family protein [Vagococcus intermedius]WEG72796.1 conjugal transfer protein TraX [Vagococcus intermedius]WEG74881.1 conjugal transfer protein TraX [Vagococcus intermedius]
MQKGLTSYQMKLVGVTLMVCDHIHQMFVMQGAPMYLTMLGRVVAPIFLFLSAEGYYYTHNKLAYLRNLLGGFWIMSSIQWFLPRLVPNDDIVITNNIFGTLFLTVLTMYGLDLFKKNQGKSRLVGSVLLLGIVGLGGLFLWLITQPGWLMPVALFSMVIPNIMFVEGNVIFVALGVWFYCFRGKKGLQVLGLGLVALVTTGFEFTHQLLTTNIQWMMIFSAIPIMLYNGQEGRKIKWFFYIFYPAHIVILYLLATYLVG